ncbi:MAG: type II toxin-antitoxin system VapC family toxin [Rhodoglobus sp.]
MRIYFDSSALIKRVMNEEHSMELIEAVRTFAKGGHAMATSALATIEVSRIVRSRLDEASPRVVLEAIENALSGVTECAITEEVVGIARRLGPASLRSLDAVHLATATQVDVDLVVGYDFRLLRSAEELGFRTLAPGVTE